MEPSPDLPINQPSAAYQTNPELELAFELIRFTNKNLFLTGKAGSGKTTFLRQIKSEAAKRMAVVAPTGVAAINAGGMTIHSLFQLPLGLHLPGVQRTGQEQPRRVSGKKLKLLRSLDLLVIDEISMVRADLLDAIDESLRLFRSTSRPFGGVQLLMIGDLHQLPPVNKPEDWQILSKYYDSPYFFSSRALGQTDFQSIELKHIYRQADPEFIALLNKVRNNCLDLDSLRKLNTRYLPDFRPTAGDAYITLTTTNAVAQEINTTNLNRLPGETHTFKAEVKGEFPPHSFPTESRLEFKRGAQVMFIRNEQGPERRYYNGKIGQISKIDAGAIYVQCPGESGDIDVAPAEWTNVKYALNEETKKIEEEVLGTFTQMPLKLAWAITIHKSQGLTFERAIIDAQASFASGQVYVALSRCKSFEGIVLRSPLIDSSVKTDPMIKEFSEQADRNAPSEAYLYAARKEFEGQLLRELFCFHEIKTNLDKILSLSKQHAHSLAPKVIKQLDSIAEQFQKDFFDVVDKFVPQLDRYLEQNLLPSEIDELQTRLKKASHYFTEKIDAHLLAFDAIALETDNQAANTNMMSLLQSLYLGIFTKHSCFKTCDKEFSCTAIQQAKANAELDFAKKQNRSPRSDSLLQVPQGVPHPELYRRLLVWRQQAADQINAGPQAVFPNATLRNLVVVLPDDLHQLKHISGIGKKRLKTYGLQLCDLIRDYCRENNVAANSPAVSAAIKDKTSVELPTNKQSFELFQAGKSIEQIANERNLKPSTIESHLATFIASGQLDIHLLLEKKCVEEISQRIQSHPMSSIAEHKLHFGSRYSYGQFKMVISHMQRSLAEDP